MALLEGAPQASRGSMLLGVSLKQISLTTLTFQNSILILIMHYSRMMQPSGDHRYFPSTVVFLTEVLKLAVSTTFAAHEVSQSLAPSTPATVIFEQVYNAVFLGDGWKLAIPAMLYTLSNTLQYVAIGNLDPVHYQILCQLKILTTAVFTVTLLGRALTPKRWLSLVVLTVGVSVVSIPTSANKNGTLVLHEMTDLLHSSRHEIGQRTGGLGDVAREFAKRGLDNLDQIGKAIARKSATYEGIEEDQDSYPIMNYSIGLSAALAVALLSGLTGVYFEKVLKFSGTNVSVWVRNIQLSFYSLFPALIVGICYVDGHDIAKHGFFDGYNWVVWTLIVLQTLGGILASLCINYADNIAKNFATSISIVVSFLFSVVFSDVDVPLMFLLGTSLVLFATYLYTAPDRKRRRPPPITIVKYEKTTIDSMNTPRNGGRLLTAPNPIDNVKAMGLSTSRPASPLRHHPRAASHLRE